MSSNAKENDGWEPIPKKNNNRRRQRNSAWSAPLTVEFIPPTPSNLDFQQSMLLLVGLPGSGKSTFARALEQAMPYKVSKPIISSSCNRIFELLTDYIVTDSFALFISTFESTRTN
jgi:DNA polymerase III delta prime subunit